MDISTTQRYLILGILAFLILGGIAYLESRKVDTGSATTEGGDIMKEMLPGGEERVAQKAEQYERAKEISSPDGFINTEPFVLADLIGKKVILVDFWTYSCINCQRTLPHLNSWHNSYQDDGLVIVGVHTPEFEFEKEYANVLAATKKFAVEYPVVLDNDYSTWRSYKNRYWPRKYLIDIDGFIVYDHIGEGGYEESEAAIVAALQERIDVLGLDDVVEDDAGDVSEKESNKLPRTPEIYFGSSRIEYVVNVPKRECLGGRCDYIEPDTIPLNGFAFGGDWEIADEYARSFSKNDSITLHFQGKEVNFVAGVSDADPVTARIYLDGELIDGDGVGSDVTDSTISIDTHSLYNLVNLDATEEHILRIEFIEGGVEAFTFTFG